MRGKLKQKRCDILSYPHLVLLQSESVCVDGWRWQLGDEGFSLAQPWLQFLVGLPEPSDQNLGLLQGREPLTMVLAHCIITSTERICLHLKKKKEEDMEILVLSIVSLTLQSPHSVHPLLVTNVHKLKFLLFCLFLLILHLLYPSVTHNQCVFLGVAAGLQDVVSGAEELIHSVFVSDDVDVEGPLNLQLGHRHVRLQAQWPQRCQFTLRLPDPGQLCIHGLLILKGGVGV